MFKSVAITLLFVAFSDFHAAGGWSKATGTNQTRPVYFTYCGGFSIVNRWYVNIESGRIYQ